MAIPPTARVVRAWVAANPHRIELHFLPGYSPELNPAECLNQDVKTNALGKRRPIDVSQLKADVRRFLRSCQRRPPKGARQPKADVRGFLRSRQRRATKVARYFHERHVRYAAA